MAANSTFTVNCGCSAVNTIDGDINSVWAAVQGVYPWILTVTLAKDTPISRINLVEGIVAPAYSTSGSIEYYDGLGWRVLTNFSKSSPGLDFTLANVVTARQVRFVGTGCVAPDNWYNKVPFIAEFEVYTLLTPHAATATANVVNGFVVGATITDNGYGYTNTPLVRFIGGSGSGAQAVAVVSNMQVMAVNILNTGSGYTNAPLIVIDPPFNSPVLSIAPMSWLSFSNLTVGGAYQLQKLEGAYWWSNQPVSFTATSPEFTNMVAGVADAGDYRLALTPAPAQAFATAQVINGFVVGVALTSGGSGYVTNPAVTFIGGHGSNATAVAYISGAGVVTNITITSTGFGYSDPTAVVVDPPPAVAVAPAKVLPMMQLDATALAPYRSYQTQFRSTLNPSGATWANWSGGLFTTTGVTNRQVFFITNSTGFFRLQYVP